nr:cytochrome P450 monooxygenase CYP345BA3 [Lasioderma serricorne]
MTLTVVSWPLNLLLFFIFSGYLIYKYVTRNFDYWKTRGVPYVKPIPIFGNTWKLVSFKLTIGVFFQDLYNSVKQPFFGVFIFDTPALIIKDPELVKSILIKDFSVFDNHSVLDGTNLEPLVPHMLFFTRNPEWKQSRMKLNPMFSTGKLRSMVPMVNDVGKILADHVGKSAEKGATVETKELCVKFATDVITSCFFGINANCFENEEAEFRKAAGVLFGFTWKRGIAQSSYWFAHKLAKLFKLSMFDRDTLKFLTTAFLDTMKYREDSGCIRNDLIDYMIKMKGAFSFNDNFIVSNPIQLFIAGLETTSSTICFTLFELSLNEKLQTKLREEILQCLKKHGEINYDALKDMSLLDLCIAETLRKYPVLPFLDRECNRDYTLPGTKITIEKGTAIYFPMFGFHYDEQYFPEPQKYDPYRFSGTYQDKITSGYYFPFGLGPRICIGERLGVMNSKIGLVQILSKFEVLKNDKLKTPLQFEPRSFVLGVKGGIPLKFKKLID